MIHAWHFNTYAQRRVRRHVSLDHALTYCDYFSLSLIPCATRGHGDRSASLIPAERASLALLASERSTCAVAVGTTFSRVSAKIAS